METQGDWLNAALIHTSATSHFSVTNTHRSATTSILSVTNTHRSVTTSHFSVTNKLFPPMSFSASEHTASKVVNRPLNVRMDAC